MVETIRKFCAGETRAPGFKFRIKMPSPVLSAVAVVWKGPVGWSRELTSAAL